MIRKQKGLPYKPLVLVSLLLLCIFPLLWYGRFVLSGWQTPNGVAFLSMPQAIDCLTFWKFGICKQHLISIGSYQAEAATKFQTWIAAPFLCGIGLLGFSIYHVLFITPSRSIASGMVVDGMSGLLEAARIEQKHSRFKKYAGLHIFNGWCYTLQRETNHTFIIGAPGGGKTVTFKCMINAVIERKDKAIIFDEKGDYTSIVPPSIINDTEIEPLLIAPQDERSAVWDVAGDLYVVQDAVELATRLIPDQGHIFFTQSARAVLSGCIIKLMAEKPNSWTWLDLLNETRQDNETLLKTRPSRPEAAILANSKNVVGTWPAGLT